MSQPTENDAEIGRLLHMAGKRIEPPADLVDAVRAAVQREWQVGVQQRRAARRQKIASIAVAASVATIALIAWMWRTPFVETPSLAVATVSRIEGAVTLAQAPTLKVGQTLKTGDELIVGPAAAAAIELEGGGAVRLDANTRVKFRDGRLVLGTGAVYVDSAQAPRSAAAASLPIETPLGVVRHLGTQYEVRLLPNVLRVSVREGRVETMARTGAQHIAEAGERLTMDWSGRAERQPVATYGDDWDWIARVSPMFVIDQKPLIEFLQWVGREMGREIVFGSPASEAEARRVIMRGDVADLAPDAALTAVLSTTRLIRRDHGRQIIIELQE